MAQYWLQVPVENAKEVVQRYIDANSGTLSGYVGKTVSYGQDCEVVLYGSDLASFTSDVTSIYFGTLIVSATGGESGIELLIQDNSTNQIIIISAAGTTITAGQYPYTMFNRITSASDPNTYFVGYKFSIA